MRAAVQPAAAGVLAYALTSSSPTLPAAGRRLERPHWVGERLTNPDHPLLPKSPCDESGTVSRQAGLSRLSACEARWVPRRHVHPERTNSPAGLLCDRSHG